MWIRIKTRKRMSLCTIRDDVRLIRKQAHITASDHKYVRRFIWTVRVRVTSKMWWCFLSLTPFHWEVREQEVWCVVLVLEYKKKHQFLQTQGIFSTKYFNRSRKLSFYFNIKLLTIIWTWERSFKRYNQSIHEKSSMKIRKYLKLDTEVVR